MTKYPSINPSICRSPYLIIFFYLFSSLQIFAAPIAEGCDQFLGNIILDGESPPSNFADYWNQVTVENGGKWGNVETSRDQMSWGSIDAAYKYAKQKGFLFKHHTFFWDLQKPNWIGGLSAEQQREEISEWIRLYAQRFPETDMVDVVNEPRDHTPTFKDAMGGDGATGWDWIVWAFDTARKYMPNALLLINEHNVEANMKNALIYRRIIEILHERKLVDGVGIQCHTADIQRNNATFDTIKHCIDTLASAGVPIYPSEFDLEGDDNTQLADYKRIFPYIWEHPGTRGVTLWGYQGNIWNTGAVLIKSGIERPALKWLREYVAEHKITVANRTNKKPDAVSSSITVARGSCTLRMQLVSAHDLAIRIINPHGKTVFSLSGRRFAKGENSVALPTRSLRPGSYVITVTGKRIGFNRKMVLGL